MVTALTKDANIIKAWQEETVTKVSNSICSQYIIGIRYTICSWSSEKKLSGKMPFQ